MPADAVPALAAEVAEVAARYRLALGAQRRRVMRLVMREGAVATLIGGFLGFGAAWALARSISAMNAQMAQFLTEGAVPTELAAGAPLLLGVLALGACRLPAGRLTNLDPAETLRED